MATNPSVIASTSGGVDGTSPLTLPFALVSAANRCLVAAYALTASGVPTMGTPTYDGVPGTLYVKDESDPNPYLTWGGLWYWLEADLPEDTDSHDVAFAPGGGVTRYAAGVALVAGVQQSTPWDGAGVTVSEEPADSMITINKTTTVDDPLLIGVVGAHGAGGVATPAFGAVNVWLQTPGDHLTAEGYREVPNPASHAMRWIFGAPDTPRAVACMGALVPADPAPPAGDGSSWFGAHIRGAI
jgi:hypothetical protein